jgi:hypothetical protein
MLAFHKIHFRTERQQNLDRCSFSSRFQVSTLLSLQQNIALAEKKQDGYLLRALPGVRMTGYSPLADGA